VNLEQNCYGMLQIPSRHIEEFSFALGLCFAGDLHNLAGESHAATPTSDVMLVVLFFIVSLYNYFL
jgi:hypothetical protein